MFSVASAGHGISCELDLHHAIGVTRTAWRTPTPHQTFMKSVGILLVGVVVQCDDDRFPGRHRDR
jgi:hypothetical protein